MRARVCVCARAHACFHLFTHGARYLLSTCSVPGTVAEFLWVSLDTTLASLGASPCFTVPKLLPLCQSGCLRFCVSLCVFLSSFLCRAVLLSPFLGVCASALLTPLAGLGFCKAPGQPRGPPAALTSPACPFTPSLTLPCPAVPTEPFLAPSNMGMCSASKGLCLRAPAPGPSLSAGSWGQED